MAQISEQLTELIKQRDNLADNLTAKGITAAKTETFNTLVPKVAQIQGFDGEEKILDVATKYNDTPQNPVQLNYPKNVQKNINVQLSSSTVTDFSSSKIEVCGKNLFDMSLWKTPVTETGLTIQYLENEDCLLLNGTCTLGGDRLNKKPIIGIPLNSNFNKVNTNIHYISGTVTTNNNYAMLYLKHYGDPNVNLKAVNLQNSDSFTTNNIFTNTSDISLYTFYISSGVTFDNYKFRVSMEYTDAVSGYVDTYEKFNGQTYTADSSGVIKNISSIYPLTNIFTSSDVDITVKGGAYKEILPSTGKNGFTKIYQETGSEISGGSVPQLVSLNSIPADAISLNTSIPLPFINAKLKPTDGSVWFEKSNEDMAINPDLATSTKTRTAVNKGTSQQGFDIPLTVPIDLNSGYGLYVKYTPESMGYSTDTIYSSYFGVTIGGGRCISLEPNGGSSDWGNMCEMFFYNIENVIHWRIRCLVGTDYEVGLTTYAESYGSVALDNEPIIEGLWSYFENAVVPTEVKKCSVSRTKVSSDYSIFLQRATSPYDFTTYKTDDSRECNMISPYSSVWVSIGDEYGHRLSGDLPTCELKYLSN